MLTISKPLSSGQAQTYHAKEFTSAEQNYWKQGDTILGEWQGRMAEQYGLVGGIDAQHFARLSEGQNPLTGEQLVRHRNGQEYTTADGITVNPVEHRAGWDATFSAVLLIGDKRQHQGVDAGKPFEQMQEAGMRTSQLDQIVRQKDPELLRAVEHLSRNETSTGIQLLQQQERISEIPDHKQRIEAIAKDYVARPENTLIVSPDNASRRDINDAVRAELQNSGALSKENQPMIVLTQRSELTSADRNWAALYKPADVLYYTRGSKELGIDRGTYATVVSTNPRITSSRSRGRTASTSPITPKGYTASQPTAKASAIFRRETGFSSR